jgi:hypothetical protein
MTRVGSQHHRKGGGEEIQVFLIVTTFGAKKQIKTLRFPPKILSIRPEKERPVDK